MTAYRSMGGRAPGRGGPRSPTRRRARGEASHVGAQRRSEPRVAAQPRSPRLPGVALAAEVRVVEDLADLDLCDAILVATPAQATREMASRLAAALRRAAPARRLRQGDRTRHGFCS